MDFFRLIESIRDMGLRIRWHLTGCLFFWFIFPRKIAVNLMKLPFPAARSIADMSVGHLVILLPLSALVGSGIRYSIFQTSPHMSGHVAWYSLVATVLLANKSSSALSVLLGQSWERLVPYHHLAGYIAIGNSILHGFVCYFDDGISNRLGDNVTQVSPHSSFSADYPEEEPMENYPDVLSEHSRHGETPDFLSYLVDGDVNVSGTVMTVCIISLVLTSSLRWFRKKWFDAWLASHIAFSLGIASASFVHAMTEAKLIFLWWLVDAFIRHVVNPNCCSPDTAVLKRLLPDLVEVRFRRCIRYRSGQFVRIAIHDIGQYEFHPVTISSACHESDMTVHFRVRGDWTKRLAEAAERCPEVTVSIQGPFGSFTMPLLDDSTRYPHLLLICGGIGVTPMISLVRDLVYRHNKCGKRRFKIHSVWVVQNPGIVDALPILQDDETRLILPKKLLSENMGRDPEQPSNSTVVPPDNDIVTKEGAVFQSDIYITKSSMLPSVVGPNTNYHHGRPNIKNIIADTKSNIENMHQAAFVKCTSRVAVLACGPEKLVESVKMECRKQSCSNVRIDFHDEVFDY